MKFNCDARARRKKIRDQKVRDFYSEWRPYFAWHRVKINGSDCRWMEWVERKIMYYNFGPVYGWSGVILYRPRETE